MKTPHVVGIDAGGTKVHFRSTTLDGNTIADFVQPAGAWTRLNAEGKAELLVRGLHDLGEAHPLAVGIGAHGCDSDAECDELAAAVQHELPIPVRVVNDAFLLPLSVGSTDGASVVAGTGSIAIAKDTSGKSVYAGGWGWLLGDPGSAWGIVRDAIGALTRAHDHGVADSDPLLERVARLSGACSLRETVDYLQNTAAQEWAGWAADVFDAAADGSVAAELAIQTGADGLVSLVRNLTERGAIVTHVVAGGSVIVNQPILENRVANGLCRELGIDLTVFRGDAVSGATRLALTSLPGSLEISR